jgi:hypothetical protein
MLRLITPRNKNEIECRVCRFGMRYPGGVTQVGVEFAAVFPAFWDVKFSPAGLGPILGSTRRTRAPKNFAAPSFST